jgi:hypothetical protein
MDDLGHGVFGLGQYEILYRLIPIRIDVELNLPGHALL